MLRQPTYSLSTITKSIELRLPTEKYMVIFRLLQHWTKGLKYKLFNTRVSKHR